MEALNLYTCVYKSLADLLPRLQEGGWRFLFFIGEKQQVCSQQLVLRL